MKKSKFNESKKRFPQLLREALITSFTWNLVAVVAIYVPPAYYTQPIGPVTPVVPVPKAPNTPAKPVQPVK